MGNDNKTEEQRHYENLTSYFKYLVSISIGAIAIITAVVIYLTFQNIAEAKREVTSNLDRINESVNEATEKSLTSFEILKKEARDEVQLFKNEARYFAINETKTKVSEAFEEKKIITLIENTAEEKLKEKLSGIVEEQVILTQKKAEGQLKVISKMILAVDKIRNGERMGLIQLDSIRLFSTDPLIIGLATNAFQEKAKDYEDIYKDYASGKTLKDYRDIFKIDTTVKENDLKAIKQHIYDIINSDQSLDNVAYAICVLNNITGEKFEIFDFVSINAWAEINLPTK